MDFTLPSDSYILVGSDLIWAPPGRGRRVPGARNGPFWPQKNPGACFWGRKKAPAGMATRNSYVFNRNGLFQPPKNPGACFWGRKKPLREARGLTPWFWARTGLEPQPQDQVPREGVQSASAVLRGNPYRRQLTSRNSYSARTRLKVPRLSRLGFEPGASGVRRP